VEQFIANGSVWNFATESREDALRRR